MRRLSSVGIPAPEETIVPNSPAFQSVALAGAVAIGASLIAVTPGLLPAATTPNVQTRAVQLTSGDTDLITPFDGTELGQAAGAVAAAGDPDGYSFTDLLRSIQDTVSAADYWFSQAPTAIADGNYPLALSDDLAGFNNLTVGVGNDLLSNVYAALTMSDGNAGYDLENPGQPVDFATALTQAQADLANIQTDITNALTEFGSGDNYFALVNLGEISIDTTNATDAIILGLFDSLTGAAVSA
jgi:hypothetical protein